MENKSISRGFRIPIDIHRKLNKWAKDRSQPMNLIVVHMLQSQITIEEKKRLKEQQMGVLGTMVVNFTANVQGLQSGIRNAEEATKDLDRIIHAIASAAIEGGKAASNIAMVSNGILDMSGRRKRQSKRRMLVAQKRLEQGKDVLKRKSKQGSQWTYFEFLEHVEKNHQWALPHTKACMRNHKRIMREAQEPNHWSIYRR